MSSDREAFLAAIEADDLPTALSIYGGEFLPRFAAPGAREFEEWADGERLRLRRLFVHAADRQVRTLLSTGRTREAVPLAKRARDADPETESSWRLLLETLIAARDGVSAAAEADALDRFLREDEREPEPATRALLKLARQPTGGDAEQQAPRIALHAELVGRSREFADVMSAWEAVRAGASAHLHLSAPPGLGKTRLLDDLAARLKASRSRVVHLRAQPGERAIAFAFAAQIARDLAGLPGAAGVSSASAAALVGLNPVLSNTWRVEADRSSGDEAVRKRAAAVGELMEAVTDDAPLALLLDDLHWADAASWQLLQGLSGRFAAARVLLVTASRPSTVPAAHERLRTFALAPLTLEQVGLLVESLGALPDEPWARTLPSQLHRASEGSPLDVLGILQELLEQGLLVRDANDRWSAPTPGTMSQLLAEGRMKQRRIETLERAERWALLLLALAGVPLTVERVAAAAGVAADRMLESLHALESRGLALASGDRSEWQPAHDLIAEQVESLAPPDALKAAHLAIGRLLAAAPDVSTEALLQSGMHLTRGGDREGLRRHFRTLVAQRRRAGSRSSAETLAREFLGAEWTQARERELLAVLPWRERSVLPWVAMAGVAALALVAGVAFGRQRDAVPSHASRIAYVVDDTTALEIVVTPESLDVEFPMEPARATHAVTFPARLSSGHPAHGELSPDGSQWLSLLVRPGGFTEDIAIFSQSGDTLLPTPHERDDNNPMWSPDGKHIAFQTARWTPRTHLYRVAIMDVGQWKPRPLLPPSEDVFESLLGWSPDGTTVYVGRLAYTERPNELCRVGVDGRDPDCVDLPALQSVSQAAMLDESRMLLRMAQGARRFSAYFDWTTRRFSPPFLESGDLRYSPDGRYVICRGCPPGRGNDVVEIFTSSDPERRRRLVIPSSDWYGRLRWLTPPRRTPIAGVRVMAPANVATGNAAQLVAHGIGLDGQRVPLSRVHWISRAPSVLETSANGIATGRSQGTAWVVADAYGLGTDSVLVTVGPSATQEVLRTVSVLDWRNAFRMFGDPLPEPIVWRGDSALLETRNDDPSYAGGAYTKMAWRAAGGLGADVVVRVPRSKYQWQMAGMGFISVSDSLALARWDHRTGGMQSRYQSSLCVFSTMYGEGYSNSGFVAATFADAYHMVPADPSVHDGTPTRVRLQLFEDGRCGIALNGRPIAISRSPVTTGAPVQLQVSLHSHDTRVRIGPVTVWRGVKRDVDWSRLPADTTRE